MKLLNERTAIKSEIRARPLSIAQVRLHLIYKLFQLHQYMYVFMCKESMHLVVCTCTDTLWSLYLCTSLIWQQFEYR